MKSAIQRFFLVFLSAWLLIGHVGFAYRISDCLVTGKKKVTWAAPVSPKSSSSSNETSISRAACYEYAHIQVKFSFDQQIKKVQNTLDQTLLCSEVFVPTFSNQATLVGIDWEEPIQEFSYLRPLHERLAFIQRYNI
ncbi:hypothetical protein EWU23_12740 [Cytophagaceae bacterium 50C-KIRBA]|uniref:Uncharacterized protein n=1 Tax=Aquirufa beregesia TaxID=2516556 RepID=A0ABX0F649_9BACT|nr:hypothetical protein [Aquirufa beregesia]NGZ45345.1 hypothetical protein [Aquirufa beregesia]